MDAELKDLIERAPHDHSTAIVAARYLQGYRFGYRQNGVAYYWRQGREDGIVLPWMTHSECMEIINLHIAYEAKVNQFEESYDSHIEEMALGFGAW